MKTNSMLRLGATVTMLTMMFGLLFAVGAPIHIQAVKTDSAQLYFVDGMTHDLPAADNGAANESRLDEAVKTVYFRLRSDNAASADTRTYIAPAALPLARTEGRGIQGEDSGESG